MIKEETEFYTIAEVKRILRLSTQTIQKLLRSKELLGSKPRNKWIVSRKSVSEYLHKHSNEPK